MPVVRFGSVVDWCAAIDEGGDGGDATQIRDMSGPIHRNLDILLATDKAESLHSPISVGSSPVLELSPPERFFLVGTWICNQTLPDSCPGHVHVVVVLAADGRSPGASAVGD